MCETVALMLSAPILTNLSMKDNLKKQSITKPDILINYHTLS